jgi:hypothetical protein
MTTSENNNDVAALKAEVEFWKAKAYEAEQSEGKLETEVERLRMRVECAADWLEYMGRSKSAATLRSELAPAPKEPVSIPTDLNQQNKENTHSLNKWRELGPSETIQATEDSSVVEPASAPDHLHKWMRLQESINKDIAEELQLLRDEIQKLKEQPHFHHESYCRKCHEVVTNNV